MKKIIKKYIFSIRLIINLIIAISITCCNYLIYFDLDYKVFVLSFITVAFYCFCYVYLDHYKIFHHPEFSTVKLLDTKKKEGKLSIETYNSIYVAATCTIFLLYMFFSMFLPFVLDVMANILFEIGSMLKAIASIFKLIPIP